MKKFFSVLIAAVVLITALFMFTGCTGEQTPPPEVKIEDLYGKWSYTKDDGGYISVSFHENMRYTMTDALRGGAVNSMGDYTLDGNKITMKPSEGTKSTVHEITSFGDGKMVWGSGSTAREYKKEK